MNKLTIGKLRTELENVQDNESLKIGYLYGNYNKIPLRQRRLLQDNVRLLKEYHTNLLALIGYLTVNK